jgi:hypothetical protein
MNDALPDTLWTIADLARFLRFSESTVRSMNSRSPERLPPRVRYLAHPRWNPDVVREWSRQTAVTKAKGGRPRKTPVLVFAQSET